MNPSFKPPPPLSDDVKTEMWTAYMKDPAKNNLRALSQQYQVSMKRVDAILRLKGMEHDWEKVNNYSNCSYDVYTISLEDTHMVNNLS